MHSGKLTYEQKTEFMRHLDLIDLRIDPINPFQLYPIAAKPSARKPRQSDSDEVLDVSKLTPPSSLQEIF